MLKEILPLDRPLVVFDTETTGTNPRSDRIVEIACVKVHPDGRRETWHKRINPGVPIPPSSTAIHGISDVDVTGQPRFAEIAGELGHFLAGCDLAGYNITGFDLPVLRTEFLRAGVSFEISERRLVDAQRIFFAREPRHLTAAARFYCQSDHNGAHGALADAEMTLQVLVGELKRYDDLPRSVSELHRLFCAGLDQDIDPEGRFRLVNGEPTVNFGKNRGRTLKDMSRNEPGFIKWILKGDFSKPVKEIARRFLPPESTQSLPLGSVGETPAAQALEPAAVPAVPSPPVPNPVPAGAAPVIPALSASRTTGSTGDLFSALEDDPSPASAVPAITEAK